MQTANSLEQVAQELKQLREAVESLERQVSGVITEHPHIVRIPGVQGGEPIVGNKGVTVRTIVALSRQSLSPEQIVSEYDRTLTLAKVYDSISYYHDHLEEIEAYFSRHRDALAS